MDTSERVRWLRPSEVTDLFESAGLFRVPPSTLGDWAKSGKLTYIRTLGGHRRYREAEIRALVAGLSEAA